MKRFAGTAHALVALSVLAISLLYGCAAVPAVPSMQKLQASIPRAQADVDALGREMDGARADAPPAELAHLDDASSTWSDLKAVLVQIGAEAQAAAQQIVRLTDDDKSVRGSIGWRIEQFILRCFWTCLIGFALLWIGAGVLFVFFGSAGGWIGTLASELHALLPAMNPFNWLAALKTKLAGTTTTTAASAKAAAPAPAATMTTAGKISYIDPGTAATLSGGT